MFIKIILGLYINAGEYALKNKRRLKINTPKYL